MGTQRYPPLTPNEVVAILTALGFEHRQGGRGDHAKYIREASRNRQRAAVTVDMGVRDFHVELIQSMIRQSGFKREEFYGATKRTARSAQVAHFQVEPDAE